MGRVVGLAKLQIVIALYYDSLVHLSGPGTFMNEKKVPALSPRSLNKPKLQEKQLQGNIGGLSAENIENGIAMLKQQLNSLQIENKKAENKLKVISGVADPKSKQESRFAFLG